MFTRDADFSELALADRAGCIWLLGLMFFSGGCLVAAILLGATTGPQPTGWVFVMASVIALAHIGAGAWLLATTPAITVWLARDRPVLRITKRWFVVRRERVIRLEEMAGLTMRKEKDSDGDPVYRLELRLQDGSDVRLHSVALHGRQEIDAAIETLRVWSSNRLPVRTRSEV